ncbi:MAG: hypothetical protein JNK78_14815 [Planctomycetes bacterium]|nr:hypothetical protein [Planctomycetota bacterium]
MRKVRFLRAIAMASSCPVLVLSAACSSTDPARKWVEQSALVTGAAPGDKEAKAKDLVKVLEKEIEKLDSLKKGLSAAADKKDAGEIDRSANSVATAFGAEADLFQEPKPAKTPMQELLSDKTPKSLGAAFENVSMETFRQAFAQDEAVKESKKAKETSLEGFNFGTGIGATFDMHSGSRVKSASIRDGTVRVDEEGDAQLGFVLETHYFFGASKPRLWGTGPFVAIKMGENDLIDEAGLGWMLGLRRRVEDTNSFNIGVGVMVDPDAEVLADGFIANQPAPAGATDVATKKEERFSFAIVFSYTF